MTVSQRLREAARPIWDRCLTHPFVTGIGDGTLPVEKFRYFMLQDYLYLFDYARVFALGVVKARDAALMRVFARNVDAILQGGGQPAPLGILQHPESILQIFRACDTARQLRTAQGIAALLLIRKDLHTIGKGHVVLQVFIHPVPPPSRP